MSLIDDIKKDREAGTPGPWAVPDQTWSTKLTVDVEGDLLIPCAGTGGAMSYSNTICTLDWRGSACWDANARRIARVPDMEAALLAADALARSIEGLIDESQGVYGLHLNGDVAPWSDLTEGGRYEEWLNALSAYREATK